MSSINGYDIEGITINGQTVKSVTINGYTVYSNLVTRPTWDGGLDNYRRVVVSPYNNDYVYAGEGGTIHKYDYGSQSRVWQSELGTMVGLPDMVINPIGTRLFVAVTSTDIFEIDTSTGTNKLISTNNNEDVTALSMNSDGSKLYSLWPDSKKIVCYDPRAFEKRPWEFYSSTTLNTFVESRSGDYIFSGDSSGYVKKVSTSDASVSWTASMGRSIKAMAMGYNDNYVYVMDHDEVIKEIEVSNGSVRTILSTPPNPEIQTLEPSRDGNHIFTHGSGKFYKINTSDGSYSSIFAGASHNDATQIVTSPDGHRVYVAPAGSGPIEINADSMISSFVVFEDNSISLPSITIGNINDSSIEITATAVTSGTEMYIGLGLGAKVPDVTLGTESISNHLFTGLDPASEYTVTARSCDTSTGKCSYIAYEVASTIGTAQTAYWDFITTGDSTTMSKDHFVLSHSLYDPDMAQAALEEELPASSVTLGDIADIMDDGSGIHWYFYAREL